MSDIIDYIEHKYEEIKTYAEEHPLQMAALAIGGPALMIGTAAGEKALKAILPIVILEEVGAGIVAVGKAVAKSAAEGGANCAPEASHEKPHSSKEGDKVPATQPSESKPSSTTKPSDATTQPVGQLSAPHESWFNRILHEK